MPNWQPNWQDVRWNWGAADAAARALRDTANQLDSATDQRVSVAGVAQVEWQGNYRMRFDMELSSLVQRAHALANEMRLAAARIDDASRRAAEEQRRRERERERWRAEKREEEERERRSREQKRRP